MADEPLTWYPLYWLYNDFWSWNYSMPGDKNKPTITYSVEHPGHIHFFMMDFPTTSETQQAYFGEQKYKFELVNVWGEGSSDINQQNNIRVVGRPKWYFRIVEYWRRVYIQDWDNTDYEMVEKDMDYKIFRLYDFSTEKFDIVDPIYTNDFDRTYREINFGCDMFLKYLQKKHKLLKATN
jgi:hypothetical protein